MLNLLLFVSALCSSHPGIPIDINYRLPEGYSCEEIQSDSLFSVTESDTRSGTFTIVPLTLQDTLLLPVLTAWNEAGDTLSVFAERPIAVVSLSFPDSLMSPSLPPFPGAVSIPAGLPENYIHNVSFWLVWGTPPGFPWLWVVSGAVLMAASTLMIIRKKRGGIENETTPSESIPGGKAAENQALKLLESENFLHGKWPELYAQVDVQLRETIAGKFGVVNRALTLNQIARALSASAEGRKFLEEASPLKKEIILQRFADWGTSREKAAGFIRKLAALRKRWTR